MAAFGISFPKLTLCRSTATIKTDMNTLPTSTSIPTVVKETTTNAATVLSTSTVRTLSLSIRNVPSQSLHYDVSTTAGKKKTSTIASMLAIDGETKQLSKTLSVYNELQIDDGKQRTNTSYCLDALAKENI
jgi:hypothetical protein